MNRRDPFGPIFNLCCDPIRDEIVERWESDGGLRTSYCCAMCGLIYELRKD